MRLRYLYRIYDLPEYRVAATIDRAPKETPLVLSIEEVKVLFKKTLSCHKTPFALAGFFIGCWDFAMLESFATYHIKDIDIG